MIRHTFADDEKFPRLEIEGLRPMLFDGSQKRIRRYMAMQHRDGRMHEPDFARAMIEAMRAVRPRVVFDVGAFIGYFSIMAAAASDHDTLICAFEANPESYRLVCANIAANPHLAPSRILPVCAGVAGRSELAKKVSILGFAMFDGWGDDVFARMPHRDPAEVVRTHIDLVAIDDFCAKTGIVPCVIKMDIEGWECVAVAGARATIERHMPTILVEVHAQVRLAEFGYTQQRFLRELRDFGYDLFLVADHKQSADDVRQFQFLTSSMIEAHTETRNTAVVAVSPRHAAFRDRMQKVAEA